MSKPLYPGAPRAQIRRAALCILVALSLSCTRSEEKIRNLIILIGDGMGPQQIGLALAYARYAGSPAAKDRRLAIERIMREGTTGLALTSPEGFLVADSAASGTQIATGRSSRPGMIGVDSDGNPADTILEKARRSGRSAGLVSDTRITHATPASFAAHRPVRTMENEIAGDLLDSGAEVLLSGGLRHWLPENADDASLKTHALLRKSIPPHLSLRSARRDGRNLIQEAQKKGYEAVFERKGLLRSSSPKILGLFAESEMPDAIRVSRSRADRGRAIPTLAEMTEKALEVLSRNEKGFFLMVEAGQIDYACHHSDAGRLLHEMLVFDETLERIYQWARGRSDTLVVVIADHETGGFAFSYSRYNIPPGMKLPGKAFRGREYRPMNNYVSPSVLDSLHAQRKSFNDIRMEFDALPPGLRTPGNLARIFNEAVEFKISTKQAGDILAMENAPPGVTARGKKIYRLPRINDFKEFYMASGESRNNLMGRAIARDQSVVWSTGSHTASPVLLVAWGPEKHASRFRGVHHTTEVHDLMVEALGL
jgi:alkaline phosphatase